MKSIRQKRGFESRAFTLDPESGFIDVELKTIKKRRRYRIHLSEVGNEIQYYSKKEIGKKIFYVISALIAAVSFGYYLLGDPENSGRYAFNAIAWGIFALSGIFKPSKDDLVIANGHKPVSLFRNKPNPEQALAFANFLIERANHTKKEMLIDFELGPEQFEANIQWLQSVRIINKSEYEDLQKDYRLKHLL